MNLNEVEKSLDLFSEQCSQAWEESKKLDAPSKNIQNVIVCGMGGSRFTPLSLKFLFMDRLKVPYEIIDGYMLPSYVSKNTLVILSSYSGTTEEVLSCARQITNKDCEVAVITSGGDLTKMAQENNWLSYIFDPKNNPSGQPRLGSGYMLVGHIGILVSYGLLDITDQEMSDSIDFLKNITKDDHRIIETFEFMKNKQVYLITSEHLRGFANGFANQINENAKAISDFRVISELNHHLMEGLTNPTSFKNDAVFIFLKSDLYSDRIRIRYPLTKDVIERQGINTHDINFIGKTKLAQVLEGFVISGYSTYYLAQYYKVDPIKIPWVDYFKSALAQPVH